ncbi:hypothetical protein LINPERPRIM_LOCUS26195 [Linum perenne]
MILFLTLSATRLRAAAAAVKRNRGGTETKIRRMERRDRRAAATLLEGPVARTRSKPGESPRRRINRLISGIALDMMLLALTTVVPAS